MDSGFIVVNKPTGATSFSMVALVRRLSGVRRVGHAGTLDPLASGVLPVAIGRATRLIEYLDDAPKRYTLGVRFGVTTDTYDAEGAVTATGDASGLTRESIESALGRFEGEILQTPPRYSAIKLAGKPMYKYAREGADVTPDARRVRIDRIVLRGYAEGLAEIDVTCGKGTYMRSLAHDAGEMLGCGAHLASLVRTSSGGFDIEDTWAPEALRELASDGRLAEAMLAPDRAVERRPAAIVGAATTRAAINGQELRFGGEGVEVCRAYSTEGDFVGMLRRRPDGAWHPEKVLISASDM